MTTDNLLWPEEYKEFMQIENEEYLVEIKWSKDPFQDYKRLAINYYTCGLYVIEYIIKCENDNIKSDTWFFPAIFMIRQSLELGLKGLICRICNKKKDIQTIFEDAGHDLSELFNKYSTSNENYLTQQEKEWLEQYFSSIEEIDEKSDLFRFPFEDKFLYVYRNKFLDSIKVANNLIQAFILVKKCLECVAYTVMDEFDETLEPRFLILSTHGIGNCYLWQPLSNNGFYAKITGYLEVAEFVFYLDKMGKEEKVYPLMFLLRNTIELCLKRIFYSRVEKGIPKHIFWSKRKSHQIRKELWKNVKPVLENYANKAEDIEQLDIIEKELLDIDKIDKNGDMFRYPTTYSLEYKMHEVAIDLKYAYEYIRAIINFFEGCDCMLDAMADYENEMRQYYT